MAREVRVIYRGDGRHQKTVPATLTTDHAASSYGLPVVLIDGEAHGPADLPGDTWVSFGQFEPNDLAAESLWDAVHRAGFRVVN